MTADIEQTRDWFNQVNQDSQLKLTQIPFKDCQKWQYETGSLQHETGAFFSLIGLRSYNAVKLDPESDQYNAMIDQPEIGWLGFIIRRGSNGIEWLLQAKTEPGNISATHLAPSIQATRSNYKRVHGGRETAFLDIFNNAQTFVSDGPHSEQGTKFIWKFNRNSVLALPRTVNLGIEKLKNWMWCNSTVVRKFLSEDYTINTDARSVISTAPWSLLAYNMVLFSAPVLALSYKPYIFPIRINTLIQRLKPERPGSVPRWENVAMDKMEGWEMNDHELLDPQKHPIVRCYEVEVKGREVDNWCQPFLMHDGEPDHVLLMRLTKNGAEFFLRIYTEIGFGLRKEFGPSLHSLHEMPAEMINWYEPSKSRELLRVHQSDEGGRFMTAAACYRIVLCEDIPQRPEYPFGVWLNLAVIEKLVNSSGSTTNELRTLVSLLLSQSFDDACAEL